MYCFQIFRKQSEFTGKNLPPGIGAPPGLCTVNLAPPSDFGPPPGFGNIICQEIRASTSDTVKSLDENVDVNISKIEKEGGK